MYLREAVAAAVTPNPSCQRIACSQRITGEPVRRDGRVWCSDECASIYAACQSDTTRNVPRDDTGWTWAPPTKRSA